MLSAAIAEDVAKVFPELVLRNEKGEPETVRYHHLVPLLLNELQQQRRLVADQQRRLDELSRLVEMLRRRDRQP